MGMGERDAVLVARAREGDASAFEALVRRYLRPAHAVALARLGDPAEAEDVCQDAFVTALERLEECRKPERFGAWLLAIVRRRALDRRRHRAVREALPLAAAGEVAGGGDPHRDAENAELQQELLAALAGLTELQREVLLRRELEGASHREIAAQLGISSGSARVHLHNARRLMRERLADRRAEER